MIEKLERAIELVRRLPSDRQAYAAALLEEVATGGNVHVPDEHRDAVMEGLAQARRHERVSDADIADLWKKCGL